MNNSVKSSSLAVGLFLLNAVLFGVTEVQAGEEGDRSPGATLTGK